MKETFELAINNLLRNKTRSVLTMLGIIIGVSAVILLVSIGQGLQKYITEQFEQLGSNIIVILPGKVGGEQGFGPQGAPNFSGSKFSLEDVEDLEGIKGPIELIGAGIENPASISYQDKSVYTTIGGMTAEYAKMRNFSANAGRIITSTDVKLARKAVVLGTTLTEKLFGNQNPVGKKVTIGGQKIEVIGILSQIGTAGFGIDINSFAVMPITTVQEVFGIRSVQVIAAKAIDKESIPKVINLLEKQMAKKFRDDEYSVVDQSSLLETINQILGVVTIALGGIAAISLIVGGVGIMNIMLVTVTERTREIGLRKAVGATPKDILTQFLIEAVTLSVVGGSIGILIGFLGSLLINNFISTSVSFWSVALAFGVSAIVGIVFGVAPAIRASRLNPIDALKYE